jgi:hypothetical protein
MSGIAAGATIGSAALQGIGSFLGGKSKEKRQREALLREKEQAENNRKNALMSAFAASSEKEALARRGGIGRAVDLMQSFGNLYSPESLRRMAQGAYSPFRAAFESQSDDLAERGLTGNLAEKLGYLAPLLQANLGQASAEGNLARMQGQESLAQIKANNAKRGSDIVSGTSLGQLGRATARAGAASDLTAAQVAAKNAELTRNAQEMALANRQSTDLMGIGQRAANFELAPTLDAFKNFARMQDATYSPLQYTDRPTPLNVNYTPIDSPSAAGALLGTAGNAVGQLGGLYAQGAFDKKSGLSATDFGQTTSSSAFQGLTPAQQGSEMKLMQAYRG